MRRSACLALLLLCGCSARGPGGAPVSTSSFDIPPQQILAELPRIYRELGLPVAQVREAQFEIRSGNFAAPTLARHQFESQDYRCGAPLRALRGTSMREHASVSTLLQYDLNDGATRVQTRLTAERIATHADGSTERLTCLSTGRLERLIQELLQQAFRFG
jgi:hypothetical protein